MRLKLGRKVYGPWTRSWSTWPWTTAVHTTPVGRGSSFSWWIVVPTTRRNAQGFLTDFFSLSLLLSLSSFSLFVLTGEYSGCGVVVRGCSGGWSGNEVIGRVKYGDSIISCYVARFLRKSNLGRGFTTSHRLSAGFPNNNKPLMDRFTSNQRSFVDVFKGFNLSLTHHAPPLEVC